MMRITMALWGGLRPIPSRVALDAGILICLSFCAIKSADDGGTNSVLLLSIYAVALLTSGLTLRWPVTFPMAPLLLLQILRRMDYVAEGSWSSVSIGVLSGGLILLSAALSVLFPAVEFRPLKGAKYNVGVVDLHLPVDFSEGRRRRSLLGTESSHTLGESFDVANSGGISKSSGRGGASGGARRDFVTARLLYPTLDDPGRSPYLDPVNAPRLCSELMKVGAPGPLKSLGWMLHSWRLTRIDAKRNARLLPPTIVSSSSDDGSEKKKGMPVVVYSHGLTGVAAIYTYQALNVAANGTCVLMVDHTDGSAPMVERINGSVLAYDDGPARECYIEKKMDYADYVRVRRAQVDHRVEEVLSALRALLSLDRKDVPDLLSAGVSLIGRLDTSNITIMGHSFGGATALAAAARRPDLVTGVVAHEPAVDWMPDGARKALFPEAKLAGMSGGGYTGGTGGYRDGSDTTGNDVDSENIRSGTNQTQGDEIVEEKKDSSPDARHRPALHDVDMLFLYSDEWAKAGWGAIPLIRHMHQAGELGPCGGVSDFGIIAGSKHQEFSDTCMMTPVWLGRQTGLTGSRNPHDTAEEIGSRTLSFLGAAKARQEAVANKT